MHSLSLGEDGQYQVPLPKVLCDAEVYDRMASCADKMSNMQCCEVKDAQQRIYRGMGLVTLKTAPDTKVRYFSVIEEIDDINHLRYEVAFGPNGQPRVWEQYDNFSGRRLARIHYDSKDSPDCPSYIDRVTLYQEDQPSKRYEYNEDGQLTWTKELAQGEV